MTLGDGNNPDLATAIRSHANAAEYVPLVLIGMALLEMLGTSGAAMHIYGARFFHPTLTKDSDYGPAVATA